MKILNKSFKQKGFTLIELLVVVGIIGVLASIVLVSVNKARTLARDARRKLVLKQIRSAIEIYYNDHDDYPPSTCGDWICIGHHTSGDSCADWWTGGPGDPPNKPVACAIFDGAMKDYMKVFPDDPKNDHNCRWGDAYYYRSPYNGPKGYGAYLSIVIEDSTSCPPPFFDWGLESCGIRCGLYVPAP